MAKPEVVLDFETFYSRGYSLTGMTYVEYLADPRFRIHGLGIRYANGRKVFRADVGNALRELQQEYGQRLERCIVVVHNGAFDLLILKMKFNISPANFFDTMLLAYQINGRKEGGDGESAKLEHLAEKHGLAVKKGDLEFMAGVVEPSAAQWLELEQYAKNDVEITYQLLQVFKPLITAPETEIPLMLHTMRLFTERGIRVDLPALRVLRDEVKANMAKRLSDAGVTEDVLSSNAKFAERLNQELARTGRALPVKRGRKGDIPACAKADAEMQRLVNDNAPAVRALVQARLDKKSLDSQIARLDKMERMALATGGDLKVLLAYYGARTGRFAGAGGWNIQNLAKKGIGGRIRGLLIPHEGCAFVIVDLAQIEARVIAWLAGQDDLLQLFREYDHDPLKDVYCRSAAEVFQCEVRPVRNDDPPETKERMTALRHVGKQAVLGLGFGMGALKFMDRLHAEPKLAPLFENATLNAKACVEIVRGYRAKCDRIVALWRGLEQAAGAAICGGPQQCHGLAFSMDGRTLNIQLPSGRVLHYPEARIVEKSEVRKFLNEEGEIDEFQADEPAIVYGNGISFYGGKIAENVTQAVARDVFVENMLRLEKLGHKVLWHTHDEIVFEETQANAEAALAEVRRGMCTAPAWAADLPLAVSAAVRERYEKT